MPDKIDDVLQSWAAGRNALLYGPPATGKTRLISELFEALRTPEQATAGIQIDPANAQTPLSRPDREIPIPMPAKVVWTTFHQSYGYEDFVLGLRPEIKDGATTLRPWAGVLLDAALELADPDSEYESVVIFIDEINRGNAARIFGEFMTFLDFDYRDEGAVPLPIPLRQLRYADGESEEILRIGGATATVPDGFEFPKDVYIVATMNSVDRAAVPIDSALARRFDRIEMRPDLVALGQHWDVDPYAIPEPADENWESLTLFETGILLLDRINALIDADLGSEFELGHGLLTPLKVSDPNPWLTLAKTWDEVIFPQLEDRYSGRQEKLLDLLKIDTPASPAYAWSLRKSLNGSVVSRTLAPSRVADAPSDVIKRSFRWLAR